jgi:hypothetical protein
MSTLRYSDTSIAGSTHFQGASMGTLMVFPQKQSLLCIQQLEGHGGRLLNALIRAPERIA